MDQAQIIAFDWHRLWIGDLTPWFMLEVCFRTAVMFVWLLLMIRVIGKRGVGQFSVLELSIVVALGSAAGNPMFYADVSTVARDVGGQLGDADATRVGMVDHPQ